MREFLVAATRAPDERSIRQSTCSARRQPRKWPRGLGESGKESPPLPAMALAFPRVRERSKSKNGHGA